MTRVGHFSAGMARMATLPAFLDAELERIRPWRATSFDVVAGWGRKPSWEAARRYAQDRQLPLWTLEDGFFRSLGLGVTGSPAHSLIVDPIGIYFDATAPSRLEQMILADDLDTETRQRARRLMQQVVDWRLSKYNTAPDVPLPAGDGRPRVLVIDQTLNDASVRYGLADVVTFRRMLDEAIADNPGAEILVKIHPDVLAGKKQGYLLEAAQEAGCTLLADPRSPWAVLDAVDAVYTVTSQMGFEALLAGKTVHCFGMPFYAGWGLTHDRQSSPRRGASRDLVALFAHAVLRYPRYINPYTQQRCSPEEALGRIAEQYRQQEASRGRWLTVGLSRRKRRFVSDFLGPAADVSHVSAGPLPAAMDDNRPVVGWAASMPPEMPERAARAGRALWRVEDGFLRSVGLGVDLVEPLSLVLDSRGIYFDPTAPSNLEVLLAETRFDESLRARARALRKRLVALRLTKYNVGRSCDLNAPPGRKVILVPGQVETDASIRRGAGTVRTNRALLEATRAANPSAWIVYKPHPDVMSGARVGEVSPDGGLADRELVDADMTSLLDQVDEVHTMTSLAGFEALLRGVSVTTYGMPFYAGWGLTTDRLESLRRGRSLSLDELVAGTLILYPRYRDPVSGELVDVETAVSLLEAWKQARPAETLSLFQRVYRLVRRRR
ncbi:capsular polysaccharide biosynthesis protein [Guyparkeria hydrothermalis]|uniref:capsular polysaccharide biosynthesis protein n=1 Tax=Guyparkeria hydrothermalis TaxID=923 RepID=UPI00201FC488|nr:capsular polysaccharide biosynthesis protein [Guyparkeria hydrothermalis]MCL7745465.1 capsular polysaccharide biosynthesis protein [Guyparkeria hydrothermalis]